MTYEQIACDIVELFAQRERDRYAMHYRYFNKPTVREKTDK
jgi:hypothetical protein